MSGPTQVVLYGRPGCCLCDEARAALERVRRVRPFELEEVDIEQDERLLRVYLERIPVVTIDGNEAFEFRVDAAELERRLAERGAPGPPADPSEAAVGERPAFSPAEHL